MKSSGKSNSVLFLFGISLLIITVNISNLSPYLSGSDNFDHRKIVLLVFLLSLAGLIYLYNVKEMKLVREGSLTLIIVLGILMRLVCIYSDPVLEDDFYRYLWDGAVTASGENPYEYSPGEILEGVGNENLQKLAGESGTVINEINNPGVKTIYPSVAQAVFAISHFISPWNVTTWKFILLFFDIIVLVLLLYALSYMQLPKSNVLVYWWNPLLIKEIFNSGHMDVVVFPFVILAIILLLKNRKYMSTALISIGAGIKLWPALLLPLFLKRYSGNYRQVVSMIALFTVLSLLIFIPVLLSNVDSASGFVAYGSRWENNSSFFRIVLFGFQKIFGAVDIHPGHAGEYARLFVLILLAVWTVFVAYGNRSLNLFRKALLIAAFAFLISPTQFPWYFTWVVLFMPFAPHISILSLTVLLPFYYLRYHFDAIGDPGFFGNFIIWVEFVPVWYFIYQALRKGTLSITD